MLIDLYSIFLPLYFQINKTLADNLEFRDILYITNTAYCRHLSENWKIDFSVISFLGQSWGRSCVMWWHYHLIAHPLIPISFPLTHVTYLLTSNSSYLFGLATFLLICMSSLDLMRLALHHVAKTVVLIVLYCTGTILRRPKHSLKFWGGF